MKRTAFIFSLLFLLVHTPFAEDPGPPGYAGPGWAVLFSNDGSVEMLSLGPVMFRLTDTLFLGPTVAYEESSAEGPGIFLGGARIEGYLPALSKGWYSTSAAVSLMAGKTGLNTQAAAAGQLSVELNGGFQILPGLTLAVGPLAALSLESGAMSLMSGFTFALKEGTAYGESSLLGRGGTDLAVGGYWQGLWLRAAEQSVFIDGGGTRLQFPSGLALGITGGVLRQYVPDGENSLSVMLTGVTGEWNFRPREWLTVTPKVTAGLALYGWWNETNQTMEGGPHFMIRPEINAYLRLLPFLSLGGGIGRHMVLGEPETAIPLGALSCWAFNVQVRVGGE
ncbi:MAG: hypothetical protein JW760_12225 [Spirochaetales bacterium]|nr:hypothetical protein [Spirochaetales bacterium]